MKTKISIVGGGIIGCLTAIHLNTKGYTVSIIEKNDQLGGVLKDDTFKENIFLKGTQYLNADENWFKNIDRLLPNSFQIFKYNYGSITQIDGKKNISKKFAIPVLNIKNLEEKDFLQKSKKAKTLEDRLNLYPKKASKLLVDFIKNYNFPPNFLSANCVNNLQLSRIHLTNYDKLVAKLKKNNFFDEILALERKKIFKKDLSYSLPAYGYNNIFKNLLSELKKKNISVNLNTRINPIWKNNNLKIYNDKNEEISSDYILWTGNPTKLIKNYNSDELDSFIFRNIQINANLKKDCKKNFFLQTYIKNSKILRIHLYKLNNISKIGIECIDKNIDLKSTISESKKILENFDYNLEVDDLTINKKFSARYDLVSVNDVKTINNFQNLTEKTNLLYSPWLIYGRENKMKSILQKFKEREVI